MCVPTILASCCFVARARQDISCRGKDKFVRKLMKTTPLCQFAVQSVTFKLSRYLVATDTMVMATICVQNVTRIRRPSMGARAMGGISPALHARTQLVLWQEASGEETWRSLAAHFVANGGVQEERSCCERTREDMSCHAPTTAQERSVNSQSGFRRRAKPFPYLRTTKTSAEDVLRVVK